MDGVEGKDWVDADAPPEEHPRRRFSLRPRKPELITDATTSPEQNRHTREVKYLVLQLLRVPFIFASIWLGFEQMWWPAAFFFTVSVPMPWIAVVIANGRGEPRDSRARNVYKPAVARHHAIESEKQIALEARHGTGVEHNLPATIDHDDIINGVIDHDDPPAGH
ncbi:DUF3099 domain-containing protein [Corynebacterium breve]|uniref:DUF3099 domain-containing protein n=1 Tax=Corynebacterium breve TaxID=3049799 RepID=A0ABY8VAR9_9CORY|nr:DUF3099 domain-containing protein [Corynebacterium breve]WIM66761.1 DUF3099 domain-containing protein [Corynebacterium breve]